MNADLLSDDPADRAFIASAGHNFQGQPLHGFSIVRQYAAQTLGNKILCGGARLEERPCDPCEGVQCPRCAGTGRIVGSYPGMFIDIAVLLYVCSCEPAGVALALDAPVTFRAAAIKWAVARELAIGSPAMREATQLYWTILNELHSAQFKTPPGTEGGNA